MSIAGALITVAAGASADIPLPDRFSATACVLANESELILLVSAGGQTKWIPAWTQDLISLSGLSVGNKFSVSPQLIGSSANSPSSIVAPTFYGAGEPIAGTYPSALVRQVSGAIVNASSVVNDNNSITRFIEATVVTNATGNPNIEIWNDGTIRIRGVSNLGIETLFDILPGTPATIDIRADAINFFGPQITTIFQNGFKVNLNGIISPNPDTLLTGNQESGECGTQGPASAAGQIFGGPINFKTYMTNIPSSLTYVVLNHGNDTSFGTFNITLQGAFIAITSVAAGSCFTVRTYTTVGNTLLAHDALLHTFDHHCDGCNTVVKTQPFASLDVAKFPQGVAINYICPTCGQVESFNTSIVLTKDSTPIHVLTQAFTADVLATDPRAQGALPL